MISVGDLKDQYKQMISGHVPGGAAINAFDENSDSPLKDCLPKVRFGTKLSPRNFALLLLELPLILCELFYT